MPAWTENLNFIDTNLNLVMEPLIASAVVKAAGGVIEKIFDYITKKEPSKKAVSAVSKVYDQISPEVSSNSLRVLRVLQQAGSNLMATQIAKRAMEMAQRQEPDGRPFESDIEFRLKFLRLLGLVQPVGGSEYALTDFGLAFISKAISDNRKYSLAFA
jgi:hypothetical protein